MHQKISWPETPSMKQYFSLPSSIIYYISKNPSTSKVYSKLIQSCKYFFEKFPILVCSRIYNGGKKICSNNENYCTQKNHQCCVKIDIMKITSMFWIKNQLEICKNEIPNIYFLLPKIYLPKNSELLISQTQMSLKEFQIWASAFQKFQFYDSKITDENGEIFMVEKILESIPNITAIMYNFAYGTPAATISTMKNISKLKNLSNLKYFYLHNIPEIIPVQDFANFIKENKNVTIWFDFRWNISEEYKIQLDALTDTVIESKIPGRIISYNGQIKEKMKIMCDRFCK